MLNVFSSFREPQGIIACCNPVPPLVRQQINEMHLLIQQAREMPLLKVRSSPTPQILSSESARLLLVLFSLLGGLETLKEVRWDNCRAYLIFSPCLKDHSPLLPDVQCLEKQYFI